jgi:hypothetical protein
MEMRFSRECGRNRNIDDEEEKELSLKSERQSIENNLLLVSSETWA